MQTKYQTIDGALFSSSTEARDHEQRVIGSRLPAIMETMTVDELFKLCSDVEVDWDGDERSEKEILRDGILIPALLRNPDKFKE